PYPSLLAASRPAADDRALARALPRFPGRNPRDRHREGWEGARRAPFRKTLAARYLTGRTCARPCGLACRSAAERGTLGLGRFARGRGPRTGRPFLRSRLGLPRERALRSGRVPFALERRRNRARTARGRRLRAVGAGCH